MDFETEVTDIIERTYNVRSFRFLRPASFQYRPGQYMFVTIKGLRKPFSLSSSPTENFIEFTKKLTDSEFSTTLKRLNPGDLAEIDGPYGTFTFEGEFSKIGMLSGGIGITPLRSMVKYCHDRKVEADIALLYGCFTERDIVFKEEFEETQKEMKNFRATFAVNSASEGWPGYRGRIDTSLIEKEIPDYKERIFYTCGPPAMVNAMENLLRSLNVPQDQFRKENFAGYE